MNEALNDLPDDLEKLNPNSFWEFITFNWLRKHKVEKLVGWDWLTSTWSLDYYSIKDNEKEGKDEK